MKKVSSRLGKGRSKNLRRRGSSGVRGSVGKDRVDKVHNTVGNGNVGADDASGRVARSDENSGRVDGEGKVGSASRDEGGAVSDLRRVDSAPVNDVATSRMQRSALFGRQSR